MTDFHSLPHAEGDLTDEELRALARRLVKIHWDNYGCTYDVLPFARAVVAADRDRRPKSLNLKQQALEALEQLLRDPERGCFADAPDTIRRALEALPDE